MKLLLTLLNRQSRALAMIAAGLCLACLAGLAFAGQTALSTFRADARLASEQEDAHLTVSRLNRSRVLTVSEFTAGPNEEVAELYRDIDTRMARTLTDMEALAPTLAERRAAEQAIRGYESIASIERGALALVEQDRTADAIDMFTRDYLIERTEFLELIERLHEAMRERLAANGQQFNRAASAAQALAVAAALFFALSLVFSLRADLNRRRALGEALAQLARTRDELNEHERAAHGRFISRSPAATIELEFVHAAKLVAWLRGRGIEDLDRWLKIYPGEIRKLAPRLRVRAANRAAADLLKARDPAQLRDIQAWMSDRSLHRCLLAVLRALWERSSDSSVQVDARTFDGEARTLELHGRFGRWERDRPPTLVATVTDVTELIELRASAEQSQNAADQAAHVNTELVNTISRDLRAPLDGVLGMAASLGRTRLDAEQLDLLSVISDSAQVMRDALDRARDHSKLAAGALDLATEEFDVGAMVQTVNARFAPQARKKGLRFRVLIDDDARQRMIGDEDRIRQVFSKLAGNAIAFTRTGEVDARVGFEAGTDRGAGLLVLTVRDTGAGLSPTELADALDDRRGGGGGLAFCRRMCAALGGDLDIRSSVDAGTTVTARIGVRPATSAEEDAPRAAPDPNASKAPEMRLRVLAADDNAINRAVLRDLLEREPMDLTMVENGADAIATWRSMAFDIVLLDIHMPILSGHDVAREIRRIEGEENRGRTPILAVSASVMQSEVDACYESGMDGHVAKPIDPARLLKAVRDVTAPPTAAASSSAADAKRAGS